LITNTDYKIICECADVYTYTFFAYKLLIALKICDICNVNYRLAVELQPTYQIIKFQKETIHHQRVENYISKIPYYC